MAKSLPHNLIAIRRDCAGLSVYERFEAFVALVLTLLIAAVIAVALWRLTAHSLGVQSYVAVCRGAGVRAGSP